MWKCIKHQQHPLTMLNILIISCALAGETTKQLPTDVNWTGLSYLIAHVICLSPCIHLQLIRDFYSFYKYSIILTIQVGADCCFRYKMFTSAKTANVFCLTMGVLYHLMSGSSHAWLWYPILLCILGGEAGEPAVQSADVRQCVVYLFHHLWLTNICVWLE